MPAIRLSKTAAEIETILNGYQGLIGRVGALENQSRADVDTEGLAGKIPRVIIGRSVKMTINSSSDKGKIFSRNQLYFSYEPHIKIKGTYIDSTFKVTINSKQATTKWNGSSLIAYVPAKNKPVSGLFTIGSVGYSLSKKTITITLQYKFAKTMGDASINQKRIIPGTSRYLFVVDNKAICTKMISQRWSGTYIGSFKQRDLKVWRRKKKFKSDGKTKKLCHCYNPKRRFGYIKKKFRRGRYRSIYPQPIYFDQGMKGWFV